MKLYKQWLVATLALIPLVGILPAQAEQHQHGSTDANKPKMEHHDMMMKQHEGMMKQYMANAILFASRAQDIFATGETLLTKGAGTKNGEMMMQGAKLLMMGLHMQNRSAEGLHEHVHKLRDQLFHEMMHGDPAKGEPLKKEATKAHKAMMDYQMQVNKSKEKVMHHATALVTMGAELITKGKTATDGQMTQMGAHMMQMGMMLQGELIGEGHGNKHEMQKKVMMFRSHGGMNVEEEVVIEHH